ncbi:MAG: helix-turn-helix transcriptional regulator [Christensenellaceae bacterium]|nr:helix-turn-helix transcriptional regulator [Christensenellaceae bacterium]
MLTVALSDRIKNCRQSAGLSQEKVAELVGVSRQAVTKWETGQSAPSTENLFRLAEILGTTVDFLLADEEKSSPTPAEQIYYLYKLEQEQKAALRAVQRKARLREALFALLAFLLIYLVGRILWCDLSQSSFKGWLFSVRPAGEHSYLYGWLLSSHLFWYSMAASLLFALCGKFLLSRMTTGGFFFGIILGMIFGPYPEGAATGNTHYGWLIWGIVLFLSVITGTILESVKKKRGNEKSPA